MSRIVLTCLKASPFTQFEDDGCFCQHQPIVKQYSNKVKLSNKINPNEFSHRKMHVPAKQADTCTTGVYNPLTSFHIQAVHIRIRLYAIQPRNG